MFVVRAYINDELIALMLADTLSRANEVKKTLMMREGADDYLQISIKEHKADEQEQKSFIRTVSYELGRWVD